MSTDDGTAGAPDGAPAAPVVTTVPLLRVVRGDPDPYELAALVAVLAAQTGQPRDERSDRPASWAAYWRGVRQPARRGPDGWRDSARPR